MYHLQYSEFVIPHTAPIPHPDLSMSRSRPMAFPSAVEEPFRGWINLEELPAPVGRILLPLQRSVEIWGETSPAERGDLFPEAGTDTLRDEIKALGLPDLLDGALRTLVEVREAPMTVRVTTVGEACDAISAWAEAEGHMRTAIAWAATSATANPGNARAMYRVGLLARRRAEYHVAEPWLHQARFAARRYGDWITFVLALNGLGNLHTQRGEFRKARSVLLRALAAAERPRARVKGGRARMRVMQGEILHDLIEVAAHLQDLAGAERFAVQAFTQLPRQHPRIPMLANDVAVLWTMMGRFGRALSVFRAVQPLVAPADRLLVWCNIARCAGAEGCANLFAEAWDKVWCAVGASPQGTIPAIIFLNLARGAAGLRKWDEAEFCAIQAAEAAEARQEAGEAAEIIPVLEAIRLHRYAETPPAPSAPNDEEAASDLERGLVETLTTIRAGD
jgi:tetratricopeptide (TPR) repeat protein